MHFDFRAFLLGTGCGFLRSLLRRSHLEVAEQAGLSALAILLCGGGAGDHLIQTLEHGEPRLASEVEGTDFNESFEVLFVHRLGVEA
jgi:hypothetical protein